eukprot:CAMPEP_0173384026 /NCGR_PEP_ID=MMETSP1356-20130122/6596_1 /TAXON_ID=77927 ORGANISM="Hemiselmis virescens, Strain PCC157" /NCGR_SAMPLE_ID=MMETSP1356 /ASSEMBLY_ACC=CAM_ASM_000847 /LENGTH=372 /DNA_ID=CAMNT_0014339177 /DNA_START=173 /DNA_END=1291 /DNA_ORIENTATION=-
MEISLASFILAKQLDFTNAVKASTPGALEVTILSITPVKRRLLATSIDIDTQILFGEEVTALEGSSTLSDPGALDAAVSAASLPTTEVTTTPFVEIFCSLTPQCRVRNKKKSRMSYKLAGPPWTAKTCGSCLFQTDPVTLVLEREGDCAHNCVGTLDLSYPCMDYLGVAAGVFDNLPLVTNLSMSGNDVMGFPVGVFDGLSSEGAVVDLTCTEVTCVPPAPVNKPLTYAESLAPFTRVTFVLPKGMDPTDKCKHIANCTAGDEKGCDFWINREGLLSRGGECFYKCQELDLLNKGVRMLPHMPITVFGGMRLLRIIHVDNDLQMIPTRQFAIDDIMGRQLTIHRWPNASWTFLGKAWFTRQLPDRWSLNQEL